VPAGYDSEKFLSGAAAVRGALSDSRELKAVLGSPGVPPEGKEAVLEALASRAGLDETGRRFLKVVLKNGRLLHLSEILAGIREAVDARAGVAPARITAATELSEAEKSRLVEELSRRTGRKIRASFEVEPALLAGFVARVGSMVYDASAATAIEKFKEEAYGN
jgi:F-type H+-transporting ATPase subunit delta